MSGHWSPRCELHPAYTRRCVLLPYPVSLMASIALKRPERNRDRSTSCKDQTRLSATRAPECIRHCARTNGASMAPFKRTSSVCCMSVCSVCSSSPATTRDSQDESLTAFVQQSQVDRHYANLRHRCFPHPGYNKTTSAHSMPSGGDIQSIRSGCGPMANKGRLKRGPRCTDNQAPALPCVAAG